MFFVKPFSVVVCIFLLSTDEHVFVIVMTCAILVCFYRSMLLCHFSMILYQSHSLKELVSINHYH